jgi:hypothetical protein
MECSTKSEFLVSRQSAISLAFCLAASLLGSLTVLTALCVCEQSFTNPVNAFPTTSPTPLVGFHLMLRHINPAHT